MSYIKRLGIISAVFIFLFGIAAMNAAAQTRRVVRVYRPVYVHRHWGYDPFWNWNYDPGTGNLEPGTRNLELVF